MPSDEVIDRSPEAIARRRSSMNQARASNIRAGYVHDEELEYHTERYVLGEISRDELRQLLLPPYPVKGE
ncbi:antitoxin VbhA family protein [Neorhizobium sp. NPDC001467]|uniref:antitoxin VbhA family protein n=1 Tax=Neorhizobium sp. NPDC001467 TaxID=3390595 RepID=UPI003D03AA88